MISNTKLHIKITRIGIFPLLLIAFISGVLSTFFYIENFRKLDLTTRHEFICKSKVVNQSSFINLSFSDICGKWQNDYINLHRSILNGSLPPRYLVSVSIEGGFADRITGTLTEFFFALLTNRAFQIITYGTLPRFESAFFFPNINLSRITDDDKYISNLKYTYRGQRGYGGDRSYSADINTSLYWPMYLINSEENNQFFISSNVSKYPIGHENVETLFVASNRGRIVHLFDNPYHRSQLFQMGLRPETAPKCVFQFLFSPNNHVKEAMSKEFSILKSNNILKISINIRAGDSVFDPKYDESKTKLEFYEPYFICASTIESFARLPNQRVIWYLTSDSLRLRQLAKQKYGDKILTEENLRYFHGDCGDSDAKRYGGCTKTSQESSIRMAAGQIYAMSMCDYHVISLMSGFGRIAVILSNHWHNIYQVHTQNRSCARYDYDQLESITNTPPGI